MKEKQNAFLKLDKQTFHVQKMLNDCLLTLFKLNYIIGYVYVQKMGNKDFVIRKINTGAL